MVQIASKCNVSASMILNGMQHIAVREIPSTDAESSRRALQIRIGRVIITCEDREALTSVFSAAAQAWHQQDAAFGPRP